jgi:hypothetical protein
MNGSFDLALTICKRELIAVLPEKGSQFIQKDTILFVGKSSYASLDKKENAKFAIAKRGW